MDWSNEPWRKLFTRDTASWCLLCWEARALLPQLFRKCDPSGRIDYPARVGAARAVAKLVDFPADVTSVGLTDLEQSGTVEIGARSLLLINFHAAQTAPTSTAERQRRRRERAKMDGAPVDDSEECKPANTGVTGGHAASRSVTKRREEKREKRRDDATPRARTRSKENAKPSVQLPVLADVRAASSGLLHELDMVRREVAAEFRVDLTGFSRNADQTLGGIAAALEELDGDVGAMRDLVRYTATLCAKDEIPPEHLRHMWKGDGVSIRIQAWRESKKRAELKAKHATEEAEKQAKMDADRAESQSMDVEAVVANLGGLPWERKRPT